MSGSKNTHWEISSSYQPTYTSSSYQPTYTSSSPTTTTSSSNNEEIVGNAILAVLAIPAGAAVLTYYAGKVLVKGTIAGGKLAAKGVERYQEYQRKQHELHLQQMEQRRIEACNSLQIQIDQATQYCNSVSKAPFMNDSWASRAISDVNSAASEFNSNLSLERALKLKRNLEKTIKSLQSREGKAASCQQDRDALLAQLEQTRRTIQSQSDVPSKPEIAKLNEFQNRIDSSTIKTFPSIKADFSNWTISLMNRIKSVQESMKVQSVISSLWNTLPVSHELAKKYDPAGYSELKRIESSILSVAKSDAALRFQKLFEQHKRAVEVKMNQEAEQEAKFAQIRKSYEPKLEEMEERLELANSDIVNRWAGCNLANLKQILQRIKNNLAQGDFQTADSDIGAWNESYTTMLTEAGLKQQAEERRLYLIEAIQTELPKLGFDIQSLSSKSDAMTDTVIKVVPHTQNGGQRQRITITVPQAANEPVNYIFDGYNLKYNRVEGKTVVENDTGKQTVMDITAALKPYGIALFEPDWPGNPDKIQKNADSLPDDNNPAEELERTQPAVKYRSMELN